MRLRPCLLTAPAFASQPQEFADILQREKAVGLFDHSRSFKTNPFPATLASDL